MLPPFLQSLINNESLSGRYDQYSLQGIQSLLEHLGNPHRSLKCIHIAGTNGKGSTAHMIANILQTNGYTVGLYTSPHLLRYNERIRINGVEISDEKIIHFSSMIEQLCSLHRLNPTFFDVLTTIAFMHFSSSVDIAVIETGLGGRLDSTNVVLPLISVITPITYDHTSILGNTLDKIAYQKAGIIKNNTPVISAPQKPEAAKMLINEASAKNAPIAFVGTDIEYSITSLFPAFLFDVRCSNELFGSVSEITNIHCSVTGNFQAENAAAAIAAVLILKTGNWAIVPEKIKQAFLSLTIPGRCEIICKEPLVIYDCAHNPDALSQTLKEIQYAYNDYELECMISFMKDKDVNAMFGIIKQYTSKPVYYFQLDDSRCFVPDVDSIKRYNLITCNNREQTAHHIKSQNRGKKIIVCTGSFRLYPVVHEMFGKKQGTPHN